MRIQSALGESSEGKNCIWPNQERISNQSWGTAGKEEMKVAIILLAVALAAVAGAAVYFATVAKDAVPAIERGVALGERTEERVSGVLGVFSSLIDGG